MFSNPVGMIKVFATIVLILGLLASLVLCISMSVGLNPDYGMAFGTFFVGVVASFVTSVFLYGFGQLIEDTMLIRERLENPHYAAAKAAVGKPAAPAKPVVPAAPAAPKPAAPATQDKSAAPKSDVTFAQRAGGWNCAHCNFYNVSNPNKCIYCGKER